MADKDSARATGVDVGATLVKVAARGPDGRLELGLRPRQALGALARELAPGALGLTGAGAAALAERLSRSATRVDEFEAWRRGADRLLAEQGHALERYLLVSIGTGTSVLLAESSGTSRVGGTALGGGTLVGLGAALVGVSDFDELSALAQQGDRGRVDLLVSDIGEAPLPPRATASSFAKLALPEAEDARPGDLARATLGLVAENVGFLCTALARAHDVHTIVYAGNTLRENDLLWGILAGLSRLLGHEPVRLASGGFAGALGALEAAEATG